MAGSSVLGVVAAELIRKVRSKEDKDALAAVASRDHAQGEAAVIAAMAGAFTGTMGGMREEVERLQERLDALHKRVVEAEAALQAAAVENTALVRENTDLRTQLDTAHADVIRIRGERDTAVERVLQQEGEIRQRDAIIEAKKRVESKT